MTTTDATRTTDDFSAVLQLTAAPEAVLSLFTSADGVSRWWGPTEGDGAVGGTLATTFGDYGVNAMHVLEVSPNRVVWEPVELEGTKATGHVEEWLGTTVEIDLISTDTGTELRFRHVGLTPALACWDDCNAGWTQFMASIERCAETGTGLPFGA